MQRVTTVSDSVVIVAPADKMYDKVSDPTQMSRWSPENTGATVLGEVRGSADEGMTSTDTTNAGFVAPGTWRCPVGRRAAS